MSAVFRFWLLASDRPCGGFLDDPYRKAAISPALRRILPSSRASLIAQPPVCQRLRDAVAMVFAIDMPASDSLDP